MLTCHGCRALREPGELLSVKWYRYFKTGWTFQILRYCKLHPACRKAVDSKIQSIEESYESAERNKNVLAGTTKP